MPTSAYVAVFAAVLLPGVLYLVQAVREKGLEKSKTVLSLHWDQVAARLRTAAKDH